jgi:hypothetical protein
LYRGEGIEMVGSGATSAQHTRATLALVALALKTQQVSSVWCAGKGKHSDGGERCPENDAAGPCPAGCEVAGDESYDENAAIVAIIASVAVVLAITIALGYVCVGMKEIDDSSAGDDPAVRSPGGRTSPTLKVNRNRQSISVTNPLKDMDPEASGSDEELPDDE